MVIWTAALRWFRVGRLCCRALYHGFSMPSSGKPPNVLCGSNHRDYRKYVRIFGADMSIRDLAQLRAERVEGSGAKIPKGMDAAFTNPNTEEG
ncbi:hypothetical protein [Burkholderia sp. PAMC 28687]|uniref:hypothetical protein n=1 Tax=Burkholderia sp. PAMC 28687 TaxID=1795874 RepID=UPI000B15E03C|nr:hypothetical protein [Burkholderia sp. PAMC 28687]